MRTTRLPFWANKANILSIIKSGRQHSVTSPPAWHRRTSTTPLLRHLLIFCWLALVLLTIATIPKYHWPSSSSKYSLSSLAVVKGGNFALSPTHSVCVHHDPPQAPPQPGQSIQSAIRWEKPPPPPQHHHNQESSAKNVIRTSEDFNFVHNTRHAWMWGVLLLL